MTFGEKNMMLMWLVIIIFTLKMASSCVLSLFCSIQLLRFNYYAFILDSLYTEFKVGKKNKATIGYLNIIILVIIYYVIIKKKFFFVF